MEEKVFKLTGYSCGWWINSDVIFKSPVKKYPPPHYSREKQRNKYLAVEVQLRALLASAPDGHLQSQATLSAQW